MPRVAFSILLGAAALTVASGSAFAADISASGADDLLANAPQVEETSGWYLRGDIGYVFNQTPDWSIPDFSADGQSLDDSWMLGIGAGLRLNDWLRFDLTADYRVRSDYSAFGLAADYSVATALANVYADLGTWNGVTPYVGAGIGAGYVSLDNIEVLGTGIGDASGFGVAWALMAGVAVQLNPNWQIDIGYRYLDLNGVDIGSGMPDMDQDAHEIRVGARYLID